MRTCFIYLPHPYLGEPDAQAPLGILYLAAVLRDDGFPVSVANLTSLPEDEAINHVPEAEIYGITVTSLELLQANRFAAELKARFPGCKVVLGGPGTISDEFVDWGVVDSIFVGEAEELIGDLVIDASMDRLRKRYVGGAVNVHALPLPARDLLKTQGGSIFAYGKRYAEGESTVLLTSRGCPFKCAFCTAPALTTKMRYRRPKDVAAEIRQVKRDFGVTQFRISDDMFMVSSSRVLALCDAIGPENVTWRISTRVKPFSYNLAKVMVEAGCREVSFGVESFDSLVLRVLKKGTTPGDNARAIDAAKRAGMVVRVLFMIKTPGQTKATVELNRFYLERLDYDIIACTTFMPIPGSDVWYHPEEYGVEIVSRNLDDYNFYFFGPDGERPIPDVIRLIGRDPAEVDAETREFREYLKEKGKVNRG